MRMHQCLAWPNFQQSRTLLAFFFTALQVLQVLQVLHALPLNQFETLEQGAHWPCFEFPRFRSTHGWFPRANHDG